MFSHFVSRAFLSVSPLIRHTFLASSKLVYAPVGYNCMYKHNYVKEYSEDDSMCADFVRDVRHNIIVFDCSTVEDIVYNVCCC